MHNTNRAEKIIVQTWIDRWVRDTPKLTVQRYQRVAGWMGGLTYKEIGDMEGVSFQAVARSVKRDVKLIIEYARAQSEV